MAKRTRLSAYEESILAEVIKLDKKIGSYNAWCIVGGGLIALFGSILSLATAANKSADFITTFAMILLSCFVGAVIGILTYRFFFRSRRLKKIHELESILRESAAREAVDVILNVDEIFRQLGDVEDLLDAIRNPRSILRELLSVELANRLETVR